LELMAGGWQYEVKTIQDPPPTDTARCRGGPPTPKE